MMKTILTLVIGLIIGGVFGYIVSPGKYRHHYRATREIRLIDDDGVPAGRIPAGTPIVTDYALRKSVDLGWWGYIPVQFDTMHAALDLGVRPGREFRSIREVTLRALSTYSSQPKGERNK